MDLRDIPGYEGTYAADDEGRIYRIELHGKPTCRQIALRTKRGYLVAHFCRDAVRKDFLAHRAVWAAFNGPIDAGLEINHKNGRKTDNRLANLEVVTKSGNALHRHRTLGVKTNFVPQRGTKNGSSKLTEDDVREIRRQYAGGTLRQKDVAAAFGISQPMVGLIVRREKWAHVT